MPAFFEREEARQLPAASSPAKRIRCHPERSRGSCSSAQQSELSTIRLSTSAIRNELKSVETEIKYSGYLDQQTKSIERLKKSEQRTIPDWFDYGKVSGLSREMNEKLSRVRPRTLGQASRIPGVTPAAVSLINVYIEIQARQQASATLVPVTPMKYWAVASPHLH